MTLAREIPGPPVETIYGAVRLWGERTPSAPALLAEGREPLSYGGLLSAVDEMGSVLNTVGIGRGRRVAVVHPGGLEMAMAILGISSYATAVPTNPESPLSELVTQLRQMRVDAVAIAADMDTPAREAAASLDLPVLSLVSDGRGAMAIEAAARRISLVSEASGPARAEDVAVVLATSGTTSHGKVVPQRHRHLILRNYYTGQSLKIGPEDRGLNLLRLFHSGGLGQGLATPLISGGSMGFLTDFSVGGFFRALETFEPTWCTGAYAFYHAIQRRIDDFAPVIERAAPRLRFLRSGTGPLNPQVADELERKFDCPILITYGTSESGVLTSDSPPPHPRKRGSAGPVLHDDVAIFDAAGETVAAGSQGEIAVCGQTVFDGYENDEAANREAFVDGWYRTGDIGYIDSDGFLFVTGRVKEMINRGGQNVSPNEIDDTLMAHADVAEAAAFPIPHATLGEDVAAAVVLTAGASVDERSLSGFLLERLAEYKMPRRLLLVDAIPKGPTGKVQRHKLAEAFGLASTDQSVPQPEPTEPTEPTEAVDGQSVRVAESIPRPPVSAEERHRILVEWNATAAAYPKDKSLPALFMEQVSRTPEAVALIFGDSRMTYRELDARSSQLANYLRDLGVGPDVIVGLSMERSLELVVGMMGVLKAGGAYLPLDPTYPPERLSYKAKNSGTRILLKTAGSAEVLPEFDGQVTFLDSDWAKIASYPGTPPDPGVGPDSVIYLIYTSGSTGKPKGVQALQKGLVNRLAWMWDAMPYGDDEVCVFKTSPMFVDSVVEVFGPLLQGVPLVIAPARLERDMAQFTPFLRDAGVTRLVLVPSLLRALLSLGPKTIEEISGIRYWYCSGERLPPELAEAFKPVLPGAQLINIYGSSEVSADVTVQDALDGSFDGDVPLGRPIWNSRIYVLDNDMEPVPVGVVGEIYVGGDCLARGYVGRSELTEERFVRDPFSEEPEARLYRMGDLGRFRSDGALEYVGRVDHQVKIRGNRVELGEVEAALASHPAVNETVVIAQEVMPGDARLIGYVVPAEGTLAGPSEGELRNHLRDLLPEFMIPARFMVMEAFPLLPNGKLNRHVLPVPEGRPDGIDYVAPRTPVEETLCAIWSEALGVERVGVHDEFFMLGGDSLQAIEMFLQIEKTLGRQLPRSVLFEAGTVAEMAENIESAGPMTCLVPIQRSGDKPIFFCVHDVNGEVLNFRSLAQRIGENQPFYGIQSVGLDGSELPPTRLEDMAARYLQEIREIQPEGPYYIGGYSLGGTIAYEMAQQLRAAGESIGLLVFLDTYAGSEERRASIAQWLGVHRRRLAALDRADIWPYLAERVSNMVEMTRAALRFRLVAAVSGLARAAGRPTPAAFRQPTDVNIQAGRDYELRPYDGDAVLFKAAPYAWAPEDAHEGWREFVRGDLQIRTIPGQHGDILEEHNVDDLARQLAECLDRGQRHDTPTGAPSSVRAKAG